jgi:hypothetical protein
MRKYVLALAAVLLLSVLVSMPAFAQDDDESTRLNLRVGFLFPSDSFTKSRISHTWSLEELTYDTKRDEAGHPILQANLGLIQTTSGSSGSMFKLGLDRIFWKKTGGDNYLTYGLGGGLYKTKAFGQSELKTGAEFFVGYCFHDAYTLELRELVVSPLDLGTNDLKPSGLMICASTRKLF